MSNFLNLSGCHPPCGVGAIRIGEPLRDDSSYLDNRWWYPSMRGRCVELLNGMYIHEKGGVLCPIL